MEAEEQFLTLFPGEKRTVTVTCTPKLSGGFLAGENYCSTDGLPEIKFCSFLTAHGDTIPDEGEGIYE